MHSFLMLDDLQLCSTLLQKESDINTRDIYVNTALLNFLHSNNFNKAKFDFLINHKYDINLQNFIGEFPISVCIANGQNNIDQVLLIKGCKINDNQTEYELVANELKINSQYWFETLLKHGANAGNIHYKISYSI